MTSSTRWLAIIPLIYGALFAAFALPGLADQDCAVGQWQRDCRFPLDVSEQVYSNALAMAFAAACRVMPDPARSESQQAMLEQSTAMTMVMIWKEEGIPIELLGNSLFRQDLGEFADENDCPVE
jgi:hypothetical protein